MTVYLRQHRTGGALPGNPGLRRWSLYVFELRGSIKCFAATI